MHESTERKRRLRQRRRNANIQAYEVWLNKALVEDLKRPDESINALVSRAMDTLRHNVPGETSHETSPFPVHPTDLETVPSPETSLASPAADSANPLQRKAALLARLRAMKAAGLSLQAMATQLNGEGVPTISGKGQWQKGTVGNLLAQGPGEP
jgi:hypothetical protein